MVHLAVELTGDPYGFAHIAKHQRLAARGRAPSIASESDPGSDNRLPEVKERRQGFHLRRKFLDQHRRLHQLR